MARRSGGCISGIVVLAILAAAAWHFRDRIPLPWTQKEEAPLVVSEAAAQSAEEKIGRLRGGHDTIHLSEVELTSLLRYRLQSQLADGALREPQVHLRGDTVRITGRLAVDRLPDIPELRRVRGFLPDTAEVDVRGGLRTSARGQAALRVTRASFAKFPIPHEWEAQVLERLGKKRQPGVAEDEFPIRLPPGVGGARVENGQLVLEPAQ
jgi:hypothetical protein